MLVIRILNLKAEIITIPNATVMSSAVKNYTVEARKSGVIFHTTVTIGYDAPCNTAHQLLTISSGGRYAGCVAAAPTIRAAKNSG